MKKLLLSIVMLILIFSACKKTDLRLQGYVKSNKGNPIEDVSITIEKNKKMLEATTDKTGFYMIENIPIGTWEMTIVKEDFETITENIYLTTGNAGNIFHKNFELLKPKP